MNSHQKKLTLYRIKRKFITMFFHEQWSLLVCDHEGNILKQIIPPKDRFWADPFPVEYNGKTFIFVEEQIGHRNGTLGVIELYNDLSHSGFIPILEKPYHLSFPNVFFVIEDKRNIWYMVPETPETKTIELYRALDFPFKWEFETTLMNDVIAADSTILYHDEKWWLFTSMKSDSTPLNANLSVFFSNVFPTDHWTAHPLNPVVSTLENSRMAGKIFINEGILFRPAQNCLKDYGKETNINKILVLTPADYKEEKIKTIFPERKLHAVCTHTLNYSEHYMLRDIKTRQ